MKTKTRVTIIILAMTLLGGGSLAARETFSLTADYTVPVGNDKIDPSIGVGAEFRFWGIFTLSATMYNDIVFGADNVFNIKEFRPIGLFSGGLGLKIPLGGFDLAMDWQKFFTGTASSEGVYPFSDSFRIGTSINLSNSFGIQVYYRKLFSFADKAIADPAFDIVTTEDTVDLIGLGIIFHLF